MCRISTNQWGNTRLSTMRLRVHVDRVGFPLNPGACVCVCVCVAQLLRGVLSRCASVSFTHSTRAHCLMCSACTEYSPRRCFYSWLMLGAHYDIRAHAVNCGERKCSRHVCMCVCVRQDLCPLCLHLLIVCTHLTGDTSAVSALAPLDGHAGDQTTNNWGKLWILWGRENARVLALSSDLRNKTFCI